MARPNRIKDYTFPTLNATVANSGSVLYADTVINGEIMQVEWNAWHTGSMALTFSGTGQEVWRRNAPSGAGVQIAYPMHFPEATTGSIASSAMYPFIANDILCLTLGSMASGAAVNTTNFKVKYV
jgi:hypothetical protein